jgi:tetratricopeptide (TPR) repeat protein
MSAPDNFQLATIYNDRGLAYFSLGNFELAISDFDRAIQFDTNNALAYYNRACACQRKGHYREAIHHFTLALQRDPHRAEAYISRGLIRHQLGYHQTALEDLRLGAECFCQQGQLVAYQQILKLIEQIQQTFSGFESIVV